MSAWDGAVFPGFDGLSEDMLAAATGVDFTILRSPGAGDEVFPVVMVIILFV